MRLTEKYLQGLTAERRIDLLVTGRRGLLLRVEPSRGRTRRVFRFRFKRGGENKVVTLGEYPQLRIADAHALHALCVQSADTGGDPRAVVADWHRKHAPAPPPSEVAPGPTVGDVVTEFLTHYAETERKRPEQARYLLDRNVVGVIGNVPVATLRKRHLVQCFDRIKARGSRVLANRVYSLIKQAFAVAADRDLIETLPAFPRDPPGGREAPRVRVLDDDEIKAFWHGLDTLSPADRRQKISRPLVLALKLALVTGQRRGEIAVARWADIVTEPSKPGANKNSVEQKSWRIGDTKNDRPHTVPLSALACRLLEELRELAGDSEYWLPSQRTRKANKERDRSITAAAREARELLGMQPWTPHDLRRTARTGMAGLGVPDTVAERVLNHVPGDRMIAVYNQHTYRAEMRDALDKWAAYLEKLLGNGNVVPKPKPAPSNAKRSHRLPENETRVGRSGDSEILIDPAPSTAQRHPPRVRGEPIASGTAAILE